MIRRGSWQVASSYVRSSGSGNRFVVVGPFGAPGVVVRVDWLFVFEGSTPLNASVDVGFGLSLSGSRTLENFRASGNLVHRIESGLVGASFAGLVRLRNMPGPPGFTLRTWVEYLSGPVFVVGSFRPSASATTDILVTVSVRRDVFDPVPVVQRVVGEVDDESG